MANVNGTTAQSENEQLRAQLAALQAKLEQKSRLSMKVGAKGGASLYGLGRFPTTLYVEQWKRLIEFGPEILKFLEAHKAELKLKDAAA